jgi:sugar phosphate permease
MTRQHNYFVPVVVAVTFFTVGFFLVSNVLGLAPHEIVLGLAAGGAGGLSVLCAVLCSDYRAAALVRPVA